MVVRAKNLFIYLFIYLLLDMGSVRDVRCDYDVFCDLSILSEILI